MEQKKRRGRPPLSKEEKLRRKEIREAEKAKKLRKKEVLKKSRRKTVTDIIKETKDQIVAESSPLVMSEQVQDAIEDISLVPMVDLQNIDLDNFSKAYNEQAAILSSKIYDLEEEFHIMEAQMHRLTKVMEKLAIERKLMKQLNREEQDLLYQNEQKLIAIDQQGYQYQADLPLPDWVLKIGQHLNQKPNELIVTKEITTYKYKLQNRSEQLIQLDTELGDISLVNLYMGNFSDTLKKTIEEYRKLRIDIGQEFRNKREWMKRNQVQMDAGQIMEAFSQNVSRINQIGQDFQEVMQGSKKTINEKFTQFDQMQKRLLFEKSDANRAYEFDSMFTEMFQSIDYKNK
jgi:hypothetical protein